MSNPPCARCGNQNPADIHTCTPLALKLADELERWLLVDAPTRVGVAAELRRLHAENEALREANNTFARDSLLPDHMLIVEKALIQQALEVLEWADNAMYEGTPIQVNTQKAIAALKERLE